MGYYIEVPSSKNKVDQLVELYGANLLLGTPKQWQKDPAIICVVDNGTFEAAGFCYSPQELEEFKRDDGRPRTWLLIPFAKACKLTGYKERGDT